MARAKKRMTESEFNRVVKSMNLSQQTLDIARGVLVEGRRQVEFARALGINPGTVSQAVKTVWGASGGLVWVSAMLPERQANVVKQWEAQAKADLLRKKGKVE